MEYDDIIERYAAEYGVDPAYLQALITRESGGNADAKNPNSSARGLGQFIRPTWLSILRRFPEYSSPRVHNDEYLLSLITDPETNIRATAALTQENAAGLAGALNRDLAPDDLYAAHFLGLRDAINVLTADPDSPFTHGLVRPASIKANPSIFNNVGTVGDLLDRLRLPPQPRVAAHLDPERTPVQRMKPVPRNGPVRGPTPAPAPQPIDNLIASLVDQPPAIGMRRPPPRRGPSNTPPPASGGDQSIWDSIADLFSQGDDGSPSFAESLFQPQPQPQPVILPFERRAPQFPGFRLKAARGVVPFSDDDPEAG